MHATTVKLDAKLVKLATEAKPPHLTLTAFIRELVEREAKQQQQKASALAYAEFLAKHPEEAAEMQEWEQAPLSRPPRIVVSRAAKKKKK